MHLKKNENKLKIYLEKYCTVLKCTQMRERVVKVDVLGWNKSRGWLLTNAPIGGSLEPEYGSTFFAIMDQCS